MLEMAVRGCLSLSYSEIMSSILVPRLPGEQEDSRRERGRTCGGRLIKSYLHAKKN